MTADLCPSPRDRRRAAFVDAAREAFFAQGYGATAMSAIAAKVGGSKTTLWNLFPTKAALFEAVVDDLVERFGPALDTPIEPETPVAEALQRYGEAMMGIILSPPIIDLHRLVMGEAGRFPELGALFYERGPKRGKGKLADYLRGAMARGQLAVGDADRAARQFAALCQSELHLNLVLGLSALPTAAAVAEDVARHVTLFLNGWDAQPASSRAT